MTLNPFDAATQWAKERDAEVQAAGTSVPTDNGHAGAQVTDLGKVVIGVVLVGGLLLVLSRWAGATRVSVSNGGRR